MGGKRCLQVVEVSRVQSNVQVHHFDKTDKMYTGVT